MTKLVELNLRATHFLMSFDETFGIGDENRG